MYIMLTIVNPKGVVKGDYGLMIMMRDDLPEFHMQKQSAVKVMVT